MRKRTPNAIVCIAMGCFLSGGLASSQSEESDLFKAACVGDVAQVKSLIAAGADVNARNKDGATALMGALEKGHLKVAKVLIAAGADVKTIIYGGLTKIKVGNKFGLADHEGHIVAVPRFGHIGPAGGGLFEVCLDCEKIEKPGVRGRAAVSAALKSWGYIDRTGKVVIPPKFDETRPFSEGFAVVRVGCRQGYRRDSSKHKVGGKYGYIDKSGKYLVEPQYDYARPFRNGMAAVYLGKRNRTSGGLLGGIYTRNKNDKWGYINSSGNVVIAPQYRSARDYSMGYAAVCSGDDDLWGYIDKQVLFHFVWVKGVYRVIGKRYYPVAKRSHRRYPDGRVVPFHPGAGAYEALACC